MISEAMVSGKVSNGNGAEPYKSRGSKTIQKQAFQQAFQENKRLNRDALDRALSSDVLNMRQTCTIETGATITIDRRVEAKSVISERMRTQSAGSMTWP